jgi:hypothetical protein
MAVKSSAHTGTCPPWSPFSAPAEAPTQDLALTENITNYSVCFPLDVCVVRSCGKRSKRAGKMQVDYEMAQFFCAAAAKLPPPSTRSRRRVCVRVVTSGQCSPQSTSRGTLVHLQRLY